MTSRCIECSKMLEFSNTRGAKLSDRRCKCGGKLEIIYSAEIYDMKNPVFPEDTFEWRGRIYFNARWAKSGLYVYDRNNKKYIKIDGEFEPAKKEHPKERKFVPKQPVVQANEQINVLMDIVEGKKSSKEWAELGKVDLEGFDKCANIIMLDPDGWDRKNLDESYNEKITADEFMNRLCVSTIQCTMPVIDAFRTVAVLIGAKTDEEK